MQDNAPAGSSKWRGVAKKGKRRDVGLLTPVDKQDDAQKPLLYMPSIDKLRRGDNTRPFTRTDRSSRSSSSTCEKTQLKDDCSEPVNKRSATQSEQASSAHKAKSNSSSGSAKSGSGDSSNINRNIDDITGSNRSRLQSDDVSGNNNSSRRNHSKNNEHSELLRTQSERTNSISPSLTCDSSIYANKSIVRNDDENLTGKSSDPRSVTKNDQRCNISKKKHASFIRSSYWKTGGKCNEKVKVEKQLTFDKAKSHETPSKSSSSDRSAHRITRRTSSEVSRTLHRTPDHLKSSKYKYDSHSCKDRSNFDKCSGKISEDKSFRKSKLSEKKKTEKFSDKLSNIKISNEIESITSSSRSDQRNHRSSRRSNASSSQHLQHESSYDNKLLNTSSVICSGASYDLPGNEEETDINSDLPETKCLRQKSSTKMDSNNSKNSSFILTDDKLCGSVSIKPDAVETERLTTTQMNFVKCDVKLEPLKENITLQSTPTATENEREANRTSEDPPSKSTVSFTPPTTGLAVKTETHNLLSESVDGYNLPKETDLPSSNLLGNYIPSFSKVSEETSISDTNSITCFQRFFSKNKLHARVEKEISSSIALLEEKSTSLSVTLEKKVSSNASLELPEPLNLEEAVQKSVFSSIHNLQLPPLEQSFTSIAKKTDTSPSSSWKELPESYTEERRTSVASDENCLHSSIFAGSSSLQTEILSTHLQFPEPVAATVLKKHISDPDMSNNNKPSGDNAAVDHSQDDVEVLSDQDPLAINYDEYEINFVSAKSLDKTTFLKKIISNFNENFNANDYNENSNSNSSSFELEKNCEDATKLAKSNLVSESVAKTYIADISVEYSESMRETEIPKQRVQNIEIPCNTRIIIPTKRMVVINKVPDKKIVNIAEIPFTINTGKKIRPSRGHHSTDIVYFRKEKRRKRSKADSRCDTPSTDDTLPDIEHMYSLDETLPSISTEKDTVSANMTLDEVTAVTSGASIQCPEKISPLKVKLDRKSFNMSEKAQKLVCKVIPELSPEKRVFNSNAEDRSTSKPMKVSLDDKLSPDFENSDKVSDNIQQSPLSKTKISIKASTKSNTPVNSSSAIDSSNSSDEECFRQLRRKSRISYYSPKCKFKVADLDERKLLRNDCVNGINNSSKKILQSNTTNLTDKQTILPTSSTSSDHSDAKDGKESKKTRRHTVLAEELHPETSAERRNSCGDLSTGPQRKRRGRPHRHETNIDTDHENPLDIKTKEKSDEGSVTKRSLRSTESDAKSDCITTKTTRSKEPADNVSDLITTSKINDDNKACSTIDANSAEECNTFHIKRNNLKCNLEDSPESNDDSKNIKLSEQDLKLITSDTSKNINTDDDKINYLKTSCKHTKSSLVENISHSINTTDKEAISLNSSIKTITKSIENSTEHLDSSNDIKSEADHGRRPKRQPKASKKLLESVESGSDLGLMSMSKYILEKMAKEAERKRKLEAASAKLAIERAVAFQKTDKESEPKTANEVQNRDVHKNSESQKKNSKLKPKEIKSIIKPQVNAQPCPIQMIENIEKLSGLKKLPSKTFSNSNTVSDDFFEQSMSDESSDDLENSKIFARRINDRKSGKETNEKIMSIKSISNKRRLEDEGNTMRSKKMKVSSAALSLVCCDVTHLSEGDLHRHLMKQATTGDLKHCNMLKELGYCKCNLCSVWTRDTMIAIHMQNIHNVRQETDVLKLSSLVINLKKQTVPLKPYKESDPYSKKQSNKKFVKHKTVVNSDLRIGIEDEGSSESIEKENLKVKKIKVKKSNLCENAGAKTALRSILINKDGLSSKSHCKSDVKKKSVTLKSPEVKKLKSVASSDSEVSAYDEDTDSSSSCPSAHVRSYSKKYKKKKGVRNISEFDDEDDYVPCVTEESTSLPLSERSFASSIKNNRGEVQIKAGLRSSQKLGSKLPLKNKNELTVKTRTSKLSKKHASLKNSNVSHNLSSDTVSSDEKSIDSRDSSEESAFENEDKENVPLVDLEMYTFSYENNTPTFLLMDIDNQKFKIYANMDTIFVSDVTLGDGKKQFSYLTDNNNIIYVNPKHNLFPNIKDLENYIPQPIIVMKTTKVVGQEATENIHHNIAPRSALRDSNSNMQVTNNNVSNLSPIRQKTSLSSQHSKISTLLSPHKNKSECVGKILNDIEAPVIVESDYAADDFSGLNFSIDDLELCEPSLEENAVTKDLLAHLIDTTLNVEDLCFGTEDLPDITSYSANIDGKPTSTVKTPQVVDEQRSRPIDGFHADNVDDQGNNAPSLAAPANTVNVVRKSNSVPQQKFLLRASGKTTFKFIKTSELLQAKHLPNSNMLPTKSGNVQVMSSIPTDVASSRTLKRDSICTDLIDMATMEPLAEVSEQLSIGKGHTVYERIKTPVKRKTCSIPKLLTDVVSSTPILPTKSLLQLETGESAKSSKKSAWSYLDDDSDEFLSTLEFTDTLQSPSRLDSDGSETTEARIDSPSKPSNQSSMYLPKIPSNLVDSTRYNQLNINKVTSKNSSFNLFLDSTNSLEPKKLDNSKSRVPSPSQRTLNKSVASTVSGDTKKSDNGLSSTFISPPCRNRTKQFESSKESHPGVAYSNLAYSCLSDNDIFGLWPGTLPPPVNTTRSGAHLAPSKGGPLKMNSDDGSKIVIPKKSGKPSHTTLVPTSSIEPHNISKKIIDKKSELRSVSDISSVVQNKQNNDNERESSSDELPDISCESLTQSFNFAEITPENTQLISKPSVHLNLKSPGKVLPFRSMEAQTYKSPGKVFPMDDDDCDQSFEQSECSTSPSPSLRETLIYPTDSQSLPVSDDPININRGPRVKSKGKVMDRLNAMSDKESDNESILSEDYSVLSPAIPKIKLAVSFADGSIPLEFSLDSFQQNRVSRETEINSTSGRRDQLLPAPFVSGPVSNSPMFCITSRPPRAYRPEIIDSDEDLGCISDVENISVSSANKYKRTGKHKDKKSKSKRKKKDKKELRSRGTTSKTTVRQVDDHSIKMKINLKGMTSEMVTPENTKSKKGKKRKYDNLIDSLSPTSLNEKRSRIKPNYSDVSTFLDYSDGDVCTDVSQLMASGSKLIRSPSNSRDDEPTTSADSPGISKYSKFKRVKSIKHYFTKNSERRSLQKCEYETGSGLHLSQNFVESDDDLCISPKIDPLMRCQSPPKMHSDNNDGPTSTGKMSEDDENCDDVGSTPNTSLANLKDVSCEEESALANEQTKTCGGDELDSDASTQQDAESNVFEQTDNEPLKENDEQPQRDEVVSPRQWIGRGAKLVAKVLIKDLQYGITNSRVQSVEKMNEATPEHNQELSISSASPLVTTYPDAVHSTIIKKHYSPDSGKCSSKSSQESSISTETSDDRTWLSRGAKLKAQVMITDQQSCISNTTVHSYIDDAAKQRVSSSKLPSNDIRNFFQVKSLGYSSSSMETSLKFVSARREKLPKSDIRSFLTPKTAQLREEENQPRGIKRLLNETDDTLKQETSDEHRTPNDDYNAGAIIPVSSLKLWYDLRCSRMAIAMKDTLTEPLDFEGFRKSDYKSSFKVKTLRQMAAMLNMKNWDKTSLFPVPIDYICHWDDDQLYQKLDQV